MAKNVAVVTFHSLAGYEGESACFVRRGREDKLYGNVTQPSMARLERVLDELQVKKCAAVNRTEGGISAFITY